MDEKRMKSPIIGISGIVLDCADAEELADFYEKLLGWRKTHSGGGWAGLTSPEGVVLAFQEVESYEPPVWPWKEGRQAQMLHLDWKVDDLKTAVAFAVSCGARIADPQYFTTSVTMFDPAGHTFCLEDSPEEV